ncbi:hypothetical protein V9T40_003325 [Parthenolecanium corni]|uniref:Barwin domain-containing protein n=1 Tax=Parthenolecanium corni TaxID=536013 RepID=A0AAN9TSB3_9HEMI
MNREAKKLTKMLTDDSIENGSVDIEEYLSSFAFDVVMENKQPSPFLEQLLKIQHCSNDLTDDDIIDELQNLFHAKNLREEITRYWNDTDLDVSTIDLSRMQYMEMVVQESLRLYPVFPLISRGLKTDLHLETYTIPAGTNVVISPYVIHRCTELYPDPERFDPERFSPDNIAQRHPYAFLPWSAGYRSCMGKKFATLELKIILCHIIRKVIVTTKLQRNDVKMKPQFELFKSFEYATKGFEYSFLKAWFRNNVTIRNGHDWLDRKKLLMPAYHNVVLQNYMPVFNKNSKLLTEVLADQCRLRKFIDIEDYAMRSTLDTSMETMLGIQTNSLLREIPEYVDAMKRAGDCFLKRLFTFWMHNEMLFNLSTTGRDFYKAVKQMQDFSARVMNDRKKFLMTHEKEIYEFKEIAKLRKSFLDYLLTVQRVNPTELTDDDLVDEIQAVLLGGNETVALALTYTIFMLAIYPRIQEKLRQEINQIFGGSDRDVTTEDLNRLNYMEMVILETLRLYPIFPMLSRLLEVDLKLKTCIIPAGTNIMILPYVIHRDPKLFPDPEKFDPDRFLPEAIQERHAYSYLSFSAGYRVCMGKKFAFRELKIALATIFRSLTVSTTMKREDMKVSPQISLKSTSHDRCYSYNEIRNVIGENLEYTNVQDFKNLKYFENVINETLRLYTPVPLIARKVEEDIRLPSNYVLPAGSAVNFNSLALHRNKKYFSKAEEFIPERFDDKEMYSQGFNFVPFSAGPRNCLGQKFAMLEMKVVLSVILLHHRLLLSVHVKELTLETGIVLQSLENFPVRKTARNIRATY